MIHFNNKAHSPNWGLYDCRSRTWHTKPSREASKLQMRLYKGELTGRKMDPETKLFRLAVIVAKPGQEIELQKAWDKNHKKIKS